MIDPVSLIIWLVLMIFILALIYYALQLAPFQAPLRNLLLLLAVVLVLIWTLDRFGLLARVR